jgi:RimJ/RimL family protein N-acetyltransferase
MLKWAPWCHPGYSVSDCTSWLSSRSQMWSEGIEYDFVIFDTKDNTFLGGCAIDQINRKHNFATLGYWVRSSQTGKGIATAAVRLIIRLGFKTLSFTRLEIVVAVQNKASQRVAEKVGAVREGSSQKPPLSCATRLTTLSCFLSFLRICRNKNLIFFCHSQRLIYVLKSNFTYSNLFY